MLSWPGRHKHFTVRRFGLDVIQYTRHRMICVKVLVLFHATARQLYGLFELGPLNEARRVCNVCATAICGDGGGSDDDDNG